LLQDKKMCKRCAAQRCFALLTKLNKLPKSLQIAHFKIKKQVFNLLLVRVTGLEPVRRETHAPQTCLSAYSSTLAFISHFFREQY
jgi:hypothetical protein